jgi:hypothetical protein
MNGFCVLAFALVGSTVLTMFANRKHMISFENSLDESQKKIYKEIKRERFLIFVASTVFASFVGAWIQYTRANMCMSVSAMLTTQMLGYLLWPKSKYMLDHVKTPEQTSLWLQKYKHMTFLGNFGNILGIFMYLISK